MAFNYTGFPRTIPKNTSFQIALLNAIHNQHNQSSPETHTPELYKSTGVFDGNRVLHDFQVGRMEVCSRKQYCVVTALKHPVMGKQEKLG